MIRKEKKRTKEHQFLEKLQRTVAFIRRREKKRESKT